MSTEKRVLINSLLRFVLNFAKYLDTSAKDFRFPGSSFSGKNKQTEVTACLTGSFKALADTRRSAVCVNALKMLIIG